MKLNHMLTGFFCLLLVGCGSGGIAAVKPEIDVEIVNRSASDLQNAKASFGEYSCEWGWVVKAATKGFGFYPHPITDQVHLHWDTSDGHRMEKIDLREVYPRGKSGRLTFAVYDDRVEVSFRPKE